MPVDLCLFVWLGLALAVGTFPADRSFSARLFVGLFWPVCLLWALYQGAKEFFRAD